MKFTPLIALLCAATPVVATPTVVVEKGKLAEAVWAFPSIVSPRRGDLAENAKLSLAEGSLDSKSAPLAEFANGTVSSRGDDSTQAAFISHQELKGGCLLMDLGAVTAVTQLNTYSFHEYPADGGARGPQVYTVYGSADANPGIADAAKWTKIADVDTRPNKTGEGWGGMHGAQIADNGKLLGNFRHLRWDFQPTDSPRASSPRRTHTFFTEIDVHGPNTLEDAQPAQVASAGVGVDR
ncbi:MAG TPA: hypothetical protein VF258_05180, partial [Luteolibacter sp.]